MFLKIWFFLCRYKLSQLIFAWILSWPPALPCTHPFHMFSQKTLQNTTINSIIKVFVGKTSRAAPETLATTWYATFGPQRLPTRHFPSGHFPTRLLPTGLLPTKTFTYSGHFSTETLSYPDICLPRPLPTRDVYLSRHLTTSDFSLPRHFPIKTFPYQDFCLLQTLYYQDFCLLQILPYQDFCLLRLLPTSHFLLPKFLPTLFYQALFHTWSIDQGRFQNTLLLLLYVMLV